MEQKVDNNVLKADKVVNDDKREKKQRASDSEQQKQQEIEKLLK